MLEASLAPSCTVKLAATLATTSHKLVTAPRTGELPRRLATTADAAPVVEAAETRLVNRNGSFCKQQE